MYAAREDDDDDEEEEEECEEEGQVPVEVFGGHMDVVKEFVWRKGGPGMSFLSHKYTSTRFTDSLRQMNSNL